MKTIMIVSAFYAADMCAAEWHVAVPEPYQAGDTPSETFIDAAGIPRERLKQYGQQPRPTR